MRKKKKKESAGKRTAGDAQKRLVTGAPANMLKCRVQSRARRTMETTKPIHRDGKKTARWEREATKEKKERKEGQDDWLSSFKRFNVRLGIRQKAGLVHAQCTVCPYNTTESAKTRHVCSRTVCPNALLAGYFYHQLEDEVFLAERLFICKHISSHFR